MPSPEPKPSEGGWLYRVLEPYYSRECGRAGLECSVGYLGMKFLRVQGLEIQGEGFGV